MQERQSSKPEIAAQKKAIKFPAAIGDWTTYKPPKILVKKIKTGLYGFDRLSRKELDLALFIHYHFVQSFIERIKIDLNMGAEIYTSQIEQTNYLNFLRTLSGPMVQSKMVLPDTHDAVSVFFDLALASSLINHALGSHDIESINRGLTDPESKVFTAAISEYLPLFAQAFSQAVETPAFTVISSPDITIDPAMNPSSTFVAFSAEVSLGENLPGKIIIGYLGNALRSLLSRYEKKEKVRPLNFSRLTAAILSKINIPVRATLGKTVLTTGEIDRLEIGDVVSLDSKIDSAIPLSLGGLLKIPSQPGVFNKRTSARIAGFREEEKIEITPPALAPEKEEKAATPAPPPPPLEKEIPEEDLSEEEFEEEDFPEEDFEEEESPEEEQP